MSKKALLSGFIASILVWSSVLVLYGCASHPQTARERAEAEKFWTEVHNHAEVNRCETRKLDYVTVRDFYDCWKRFEREDAQKGKPQ